MKKIILWAALVVVLGCVSFPSFAASYEVSQKLNDLNALVGDRATVTLNDETREVVIRVTDRVSGEDKTLTTYADKVANQGRATYHALYHQSRGKFTVVEVILQVVDGELSFSTSGRSRGE